MAERESLNDDAGLKEAATADGKDPFEEVPDALVQQVLSFLPSVDAVRTCVLAQRWRTLWKSVPSLRINTGAEDCKSFQEDAQALCNFVNNLLRFRDPAPLHECEIHSYESAYADREELLLSNMEAWVRYTISCKVRVLQVDNMGNHPHLEISSGTLISEYLATLNLDQVYFPDGSIDFSGCQALEVLRMTNCIGNLEGNFPKSLRHLSIILSDLSPPDGRGFISAPGLVTLELADSCDLTPFVETLPSLETAFIRINSDSRDTCDSYSNHGDCGKESCEGCYKEDDCSVLLEGLSGATNLELMSQRSMIFRKDLKWCPMFSKLKTVLLDVWCLRANFTGLVHFLQYSPILERLTLQFNEDSDIEMGESYNPKEHFLVSKHLKYVVIYCWKEGEMICQILKILGTHGVTPAQITVKHESRIPFFFSFEQK